MAGVEQLLSDYYSDSKYSSNGENYIVLEGGKNQRSIFKLQCKVCNQIRSVVPASILSGGRKPCLCSKKAYKTSEDKWTRIREVFDELSVELLVDENFQITGAFSPIPVKCRQCDRHWESSYNSLVFKQAGCSSCNNTEKFSKELATEKLKSTASKSNLELIGFAYTPQGYTHNNRVDLRCNTCKKEWNTSFASIVKGSGCPSCAITGFDGNVPATLYILKVISEDNILLGYKYGITRNLEQRLKQHNKLCKRVGIFFELSYSWEYSLGHVAKQHEKAIKVNFKPYFSLKELPSGYTESISIPELSTLLDFQTKQYKEFLWQV